MIFFQIKVWISSLISKAVRMLKKVKEYLGAVTLGIEARGGSNVPSMIGEDVKWHNVRAYLLWFPGQKEKDF